MTTAIIARVPTRERRRILDSLPRDALVLVEFGGVTRTIGDPTADTVVGYVLGTAYTPGGGSSDSLIVKPASANGRLHSIPAAQVLRVRYAYPKPTVPGSYALGEVVAGPDLADTDPQEV